MAVKTKITKRKKKGEKIAGVYMLINGTVIENALKEEKTKRGFPTFLEIVKVQSGKRKLEVYKGTTNSKFRPNQFVELKCRVHKIKSGNRVSTKYILT